jgi:hypothetical protein
MAAEEVVDEFEQAEAPVVEDTAKSLTSALVFMTTFLLVVGIIVVMVATNRWFERGMFAG